MKRPELYLPVPIRRAPGGVKPAAPFHECGIETGADRKIGVGRVVPGIGVVAEHAHHVIWVIVVSIRAVPSSMICNAETVDHLLAQGRWGIAVLPPLKR